MKTTTIGCALAGLLAVSPGAAAFGLKTHLWVGEQLRKDIAANCTVRIAGHATPLPKDVCDSIREHPGQFLSGTLGPDIYPDVVTGQVTTHPGLGSAPAVDAGSCQPAGGWNTSDWLRHVYHDAPPGPELAFAAGYLVHAASDVFAHTLVNAYAGAPFDLLDGETEVERRHAIIERYVDARIPWDAKATQLKIPREFVLDKLLFSACAGREAGRVPSAWHIAMMSERRAEMERLAEEFEAGRQEAEAMWMDAVGDAAARASDLELAQRSLPDAREEMDRIRAEIVLADAAKAQIQEDYASTKAQYEAEKARVGFGDPRKVRALQAMGEQFQPFLELRQALGDATAEVERLEALHVESLVLQTDALNRAQNLKALSSLSLELRSDARKWADAMDEAGLAYIDLAHRTAIQLLKGTGAVDDDKTYGAWLGCHALAFAPVPHLVAKYKCKVRELEADIARSLERVPGFSRLVGVKERFDAYVRESVKEQVLAQLERRKDSTSQLLALMADPSLATRDALQVAFAPVESRANPPSGPGSLITLDDAASLVEREFALSPDSWDPTQAPVLAHAISLSKMSLLDRDGLHALVGGLDGDPDRLRTVDSVGRYSVLYQTVRSIDGNHQWQRHGLPYWRQANAVAPLDPGCRRFGYDASDGPGMGFPLYADATLRDTVFPKVFDDPVYGALANEMQGLPGHPTAGTDENPFPSADEMDFPAAPPGECR